MNGDRLLLDTNVIIGFLKGERRIARFLNNRLNKGALLFASQITRMEMLSYHGISKAEETRIKEFLASIQVLLLDPQIETRAIAIRREYNLKLPDAIILATALDNNCVLVTNDLDLNAKRIPGSRIEILKEINDRRIND